MNMASYDYDVIVIGSGAGGSIAAQQIATSGKKVAIVESGKLGGQVLNYSSIPTKALLQAASVFESAKRGNTYGVRTSTVGYNYPSVRAWKDTVLKNTAVHKEHQYYTKKGITVIGGRAYFINPHTISVGTARFTAQSFIVASGAQLTPPEITGLHDSGYLTHAEAINLNRPPKSIAIIGGGATGVEFAQLFAIFGSKVVLIDPADKLLKDEEPEVSSVLVKRFKNDYSIDVLLETSVISVSKNGLKRRLTVRHGGKESEIAVDEVMIASGKLAVTDIGLENAGVRYTDSLIHTDRYQRSTSKHIFAVGDCAGPYAYTHTAAYQGQIAAHNIVHPKKPTAAQYHAIPRTFFTNPEVAATGATERQLRARKTAYKTVTTPISTVAKSATSGYKTGFIKLLASTNTGALLGATVVSPNASEIIAELTLAVQYNLTADQVPHTVHAFGTWSEVVRVACAKLSKIE